MNRGESRMALTRRKIDDAIALLTMTTIELSGLASEEPQIGAQLRHIARQLNALVNDLEKDAAVNPGRRQ